MSPPTPSLKLTSTLTLTQPYTQDEVGTWPATNPGFERFLALRELGPKSWAAGDLWPWLRLTTSPPLPVISASALRERETSGTQGTRNRGRSKFSETWIVRDDYHWVCGTTETWNLAQSNSSCPLPSKEKVRKKGSIPVTLCFAWLICAGENIWWSSEIRPPCLCCTSVPSHNKSCGHLNAWCAEGPVPARCRQS